MGNFEIQVGKHYKTREGQKVIIYATDAGGKYPIHGAVIVSNGNKDVYEWDESGNFYGTHDHNMDIVSELTEPIDFDWDCLPNLADRFILMDDNGDWYCSNIEPIICDDGESWIGNGDLVSIEIPTSQAPKNYTGGWKESLNENPKYVKNY